jgi:hypothetical protein
MSWLYGRIPCALIKKEYSNRRERTELDDPVQTTYSIQNRIKEYFRKKQKGIKKFI